MSSPKPSRSTAKLGRGSADVDDSIISRETIRARGASAYDAGRGVDDHRMNPGSPAIKDWQFGWHTRRIEREQKRDIKQQLVEVSYAKA